MLIRLLRRDVRWFAIWLGTLPFLWLARTVPYVLVSQAIAMVPLRYGEYVRYAFYKRTLAACGENVTIGMGTVISYRDITLGNNVWIDGFGNLGHVDIGDYVLMARNCHVFEGAYGHPIDRTDIPIIQQPGDGIPHRIRVGPDVWIGSGAIVMADVGKGCVVGAGSVVTRPVPDMAVVAGVPARVLRMRGDGKSTAQCEAGGD